jgi:hypothetical protein
VIGKEDVHELSEKLAVEVVRLRSVNTRKRGGKEPHLLDYEVLFIDEAAISRIIRMRHEEEDYGIEG